MTRRYRCVLGVLLLIALSACGEDQQSAKVPDEKKATATAVHATHSVSAVQEAVSGETPAVPVDLGQDTPPPPADQPSSAD